MGLASNYPTLHLLSSEANEDLAENDETSIDQCLKLFEKKVGIFYDLILNRKLAYALKTLFILYVQLVIVAPRPVENFKKIDDKITLFSPCGCTELRNRSEKDILIAHID